MCIFAELDLAFCRHILDAKNYLLFFSKIVSVLKIFTYKFPNIIGALKKK